MKRLIELSNEEAIAHFLKGCSYFNGDLPKYISFEPILNDVSDVLKGSNYAKFKSENQPCQGALFLLRRSFAVETCG